MKNLNIFFELLLFPFLFLMQFKNKHKKINYKKRNNIFYFFLFFLISSTHLYADTHTYVPSEDNAITLTSSGYTDTTHETSKNDYVYYMFQLDEAGDITINVNDINTDNVRFNYSTTDYPSPDWANGLTTIDLDSLAQNDIIYITISDSDNNPSPKSYQIELILTPTSDSNLSITKTNSADIVTINENFYYIINVKNIGTDTASDVNVTDILPSDMYFNKTATNDNSPYWDCEIDSRTVTCEHNESDILAGETHTINLHVTAPSSAGDIENNVSVTGTINSSSHSDTASEITIISADIDNAENLCYTEDTIANYDTEADRDAACEKEGNFYYGQNCTASVIIVDTNASDENLIDLIVTKMYAPGLDHGEATTSRGVLESTGTPGSATGGPSSLNIADYSSYTEGYVVRDIQLDGSVKDANFTITDTGSYNNGDTMFGIALYGDYNVSGVHHSGRIYACSGASEGGIEILSSADVIDTLITAANAGNYDTSVVPNPILPNPADTNIKYIQTMVAADETRKIVGVYLDLDGHAIKYDYNGSVVKGGLLPYSITPLWADSTCSKSFGNIIDTTGNRLVIKIPSGEYSAEAQIRVPNYVKKDVRIQMIVTDPNTLSVEGQQCLDGSTTGNFEQLAQCVNSEIQYKTAFGQDAWDRCGLDSGLPCISSGNGAADPTDPSYDPATDYIYTNPLGCYMCTFNIQPSCSSDNFAIRPKAFDVNINDGDTFISGQDINLKFEATNWNDVTETYDYNETEESSFSVDINFTDATKNCPVTIQLYPSVHFVDGIEIDDFHFTDIGKDLNFTVSEINGSEYALVDYDDSNDTVRLITPLERNITIIPDHFNIDANLTDHNRNNNFTYLHDINRYDSDDNYEMGAALTIDIQAMGADNNITRNYMETCYAKETNITLVLSGTSITYPGSTQPLEYFLYYNPEEDNGSIDAGEGNYSLPAPVANTITLPSLAIENIGSSFPADAPDGNGTTHIEYKLNFDRKQNLVVNPFQMILNDVNITEIDTTVPTTDLITGDTGALTDQNATMYYARTRPSQFRPMKFIGGYHWGIMPIM
jgi:uncharacterized repeat protein (TIGR01451 family)